MARRAHVVNWNGKDVPAELEGLPAGRYMLESLDEVPLTEDEERGLEVALESYRQGAVVDAGRAREMIDAALKR